MWQTCEKQLADFTQFQRVCTEKHSKFSCSVRVMSHAHKTFTHGWSNQVDLRPKLETGVFLSSKRCFSSSCNAQAEIHVYDVYSSTSRRPQQGLRHKPNCGWMWNVQINLTWGKDCFLWILGFSEKRGIALEKVWISFFVATSSTQFTGGCRLSMEAHKNTESNWSPVVFPYISFASKISVVW